MNDLFPHGAADALPIAAFAPNAFYMRAEDNLRLTVFNSVASAVIQLRYRFLLPDGTVQVAAETLTPAATRVAANLFIPTAEGWLLGAEIVASSTSPRIGQVFAVLDVVRGDSTVPLTVACLLQGYVTDTSRLSYPGSAIRPSAEGPGCLRSLTGTDPAANVEISETVPTNARWRVHAIQFTLVTDANAANREVALTFDDGALVFARVPSGFTQVATTTVVYSAFFDAQRNTAAQDTTKNIPLPRLDLQGGMRFNTVTTNRQVGDNYSAPQYLVEEWIED